MIRTEEFAIAPSATAAILGRRWLEKRWLFFALPVVALLIMSAGDWRWAVVALMLVFIMWPMALFFVWTGAALSPEAVRLSMPHMVEFDAEGFSVIYLERENYRTPQAARFAWADVAVAEEDRHYMRFALNSGASVRVPLKSLDREQWIAVREWRMCAV